MTPKDWVTIAISSVALVLSAISFVLTFRQRSLENRRNIRKALTEVIGDLTEVSIERTKLDRENVAVIDDHVMGLRRLYNSQRRYLANHGEFLAAQIPQLVTDIDYNALATAYDAVGDYEKAQEYWERCVTASASNSIRSMNLRGFARFLFRQGNVELGRRKYQESLQLDVADTDNMRRIRSDTYLMWAKTEHEFGFPAEARRRREQSYSIAQRIGHAQMRQEMYDYIDAVWKGLTPAAREMALTATSAPSSESLTMHKDD